MLIAIRNDILYKLLPTSIFNVEHVFVKFTTNNVAFIVCSVDIPPNSPIHIYESFMSAVQTIISTHSDCVFLFCGDFNLPNASWSNDNYGLSYTSVSGTRIHCVPEIFAFHNFFQLNSVSNSSGNILDLVFSNNPNTCISKSDTVVVPSDSYHPAVDLIFTFNHELPSIDNTHNFFDFSKGCYTQICSFLTSFNWLLTITTLDIDSATHALYDALHYCVLNFVPEVKYKPSKFPSWFSRDLKSIVWEKRKKHAKYKSTQCPCDYSKLSTLLAQYKIEYKICHSEFLSRTEIRLNQNPRSFWDFVRKHKSGTGIPNSVSYNDVTSSGPESVPHIFSSYFNSVYLPNFHNHYDHGTPFSHHDLPSDCIFSVDDVDAGLSALKNVKSTGPDGLSGTFLFNIKSALCYPLWLLFRRFMDLGVFLKMLKMSSVTPIFKSGDKSDVKNYRPISILNHIAKLFELLVLRNIQPSVNNILIDEQYGFRPGRSSVSY